MKALRKNDPCWCNSGKQYCDCHMEFDRKLDNFKRKFHKIPPRSIIKNEEQLAGMRERLILRYLIMLQRIFMQE